MVYQALYRQWRPMTFSQVIGQEAVVQTLRRQIETGRIAHAYLFCGCRGTGKTSITAAFAVLAGGHAVLCDCDVDAADLHLVLEPVIRERHEFKSGHEAVIRQEDCMACGVCVELCRFVAQGE